MFVLSYFHVVIVILFLDGNLWYVLYQAMKIDELPDILTIKQASEVLNCHPNTLRNWDTEGRLIAIRFGARGDRRFRKSDILALLKTQNK